MYRGRFAPSPTGSLHLGSLLAALGSWLRARSRHGTWLVRIEDIDPPREVPGAARDILETLAAFGMVSDEPVLYQSRRIEHYQTAFEKLLAMDSVFACLCSRRELEGSPHPAHCPTGARDTTRAPAWRLRVPDTTIGFHDAIQGTFHQNLAHDVGAFVIRRVEGYFAYQLAVVVDDAAQDITEVVRGVDLLDSTPRQIWLQRLLDLPTPAYVHLPLVHDASGRKLSKQDRDRPIERGDPLPALRTALAALGYPPAWLHAAGGVDSLLRRAIDDFELTRIPRHLATTVSGTELCNIRKTSRDDGLAGDHDKRIDPSKGE